MVSVVLHVFLQQKRILTLVAKVSVNNCFTRKAPFLGRPSCQCQIHDNIEIVFLWLQIQVANATLAERTSQLQIVQRELDQRRAAQDNLDDALRKEKVGRITFVPFLL